MKSFIYSIFLVTSIYALIEKKDASPEYITRYYNLAVDEYKKNNFENSLNHIRHVIPSNMKDYRLRFLAGHNYWKKNNFEAASAHFRIAKAVQPLNWEAHIDLILLQLQSKNNRAALEFSKNSISTFQSAKQNVPVQIYNVYARSLLRTGNASMALEITQNAKAASNENSKTKLKDKIEAILLEGRAHLVKGNFEDAELDFLWASKLESKSKPENPYTSNLIGYLYEIWSKEKGKANLSEKAENYYKTALKNADNRPELIQVINENLKRIQN